MSAQTGTFMIALAAADAAAGVVSQINPEGVELAITRAVLHVRTKATAACTLDIGVASTAVSADTLLDGVDVGTAAGLFDNIINKGSNGKELLSWPASQYLTASKASGAAAGLEGELHIEYIRLEEPE